MAIQRRLARRVSAAPLARAPRLVAGVDMAILPGGERCVAGCVVWDCVGAAVRERTTAVRRLRFPYVPGLLSFREAQVVLAALGRLKTEPDVVMCDGQGFAHPRRFGLACHLGVLLDRPTLGCAKSRLTGTHREPGAKRGARTALRDGGERIGTVLRTRDGVKPVYVSIGHRISLADAERVVLVCGAGYRIPEPTRLADNLVAERKRELS